MFNFNIFVQKEDKFFVSKNLELGIVSQGLTYEESLVNLKEATILYLENENISFVNQKSNNQNYFLTSMKI